ncbi:MAG: DUF1905 domain-containing protein [Frankiaceae bacterium]|nr:DUF1905 domain-containing protein [Frankiaceae bacterium]
MDLEFSGEVIWWRGPAPWHFVIVPDPQSAEIEAVSQMATYGWGCIPATCEIGDTEFTTSLFPREGEYLVPIKAAVRKKEAIELGDEVSMRLRIKFES